MATEHDFRDNPTRLTAKKGWTTKDRPNGVVVATGILALLMLLPIAAVLSSLFDTGRGSLAHLASTILPDLVINTLGLVCMVGLGTAIVGAGTAWLVSACRFPGSRFLQWMLLLPLAMPAYIIGRVSTIGPVFLQHGCGTLVPVCWYLVALSHLLEPRQDRGGSPPPS